MRLDISMQEQYAVPIERVWHALTDPRMIERWLMNADGYEARVGAQFALGEPPRADCRGQVECEVLELDPPHRMVWSWRGAGDPDPTRLVFALETNEEGTRLTLQHTGDADERTVTNTTAGWTAKLGALTELLTHKGDNQDD